MVKYVSQSNSSAQKATFSEANKGKSAAMEKSTNAQIRKIVQKKLAAKARVQKNVQNKVKKCS